MAAPKYVFSTSTVTINVVKYSDFIPNQVPQRLHSVCIQGGANCPDKFMRTPKGIATPITAQDFDVLMADNNFLDMMRRGFMSFGNAAEDVERAARDMTPRDRSAPKVADDFKAVRNLTGGFESATAGLVVGRDVESITSPG